MSETFLEDDRSGAVLSSDRTYRYRLRRTWDVDLPTVVFLMLNPSKADETYDDPTVRRCIGFAKTWGYGTLVVGNLFALRATDPSELSEHPDPIGPDNDEHLRTICDDDRLVVAAWGQHGGLHDRGRAVAEQLDVDLFALGTTKDGHPVHPLYQPGDADPEPFAYEGGDGDD